MESVAANRKQPELIVFGEFAETHRAIERLFGAFDLFVEENGKGIDQGLIETRVVEMEQLLELSLVSVGGVGEFWVSIGIRRGGRKSRSFLL